MHCSECNTSKLTFDGVDLMGERLANEVVSVIRSRPHLQKISAVAYSLGGLIAKYAIALLYEPQPQLDPIDFQNGSTETYQNDLPLYDQPYKARIAGLEPVNFITIATPHLGSRGNSFQFFVDFLFLRKVQHKLHIGLPVGLASTFSSMMATMEGFPFSFKWLRTLTT